MVTQSASLLFSALGALRREKSKPIPPGSEKELPRPHPEEQRVDGVTAFLREPGTPRDGSPEGLTMAVSSKEICNIFSVFLESGKKKQRLSQIQKLFTKQLAKKLSGVGWGIRTMLPFQMSHMVLTVYKREWPISAFFTSPWNTPKSSSSQYVPHPHPDPLHPVPKLICPEPISETHDCWLGFRLTPTRMLG